MPVYAIAQISILDRTRYERYVAGFLPVLARYGGQLLASDEQVAVVEGDWTRDKVVILSFPDRASFDRWSTSPEYREISKDRIGATDVVMLVVRSLPAAAGGVGAADAPAGGAPIPAAGGPTGSPQQ